ncbi:MAG: CPBP family glutamic-type intramembrane protease [Dermatophilaceae bacterium]
MTTVRDPAFPTTDDVHREASRSLMVFGAILLGLSLPCMALYGVSGQQAFGAVALVSPALAAVVTRLVRREGWRDVSWRFGGRAGWRAIGVGVLLPPGIGLVSYGVAWASGLVGFDPDGSEGEGTIAAFLVTLLIAGTVTGLSLALVAVGEELGWRGHMLTRMVDAGMPRPVLLSGLLWGLWHLPLTFLVGYAAGSSVALAAPLLVLQITAAGVVIGWLRLSTGSVWPAVVFHGWWNALIQTAFDPASTGDGHETWVGESGVLTTGLLVVLALVLLRRPWVMRRWPAEEPVALPRP